MPTCSSILSGRTERKSMRIACVAQCTFRVVVIASVIVNSVFLGPKMTKNGPVSSILGAHMMCQIPHNRFLCDISEPCSGTSVSCRQLCKFLHLDSLELLHSRAAPAPPSFVSTSRAQNVDFEADQICVHARSIFLRASTTPKSDFDSADFDARQFFSFGPTLSKHAVCGMIYFKRFFFHFLIFSQPKER